MQDYSDLFPKQFRTKKFTEKEQLSIIRRFIKSGLSPVAILLCITIFLSFVHPGTSQPKA